ncbi:hypothetical protein KC353_g26 [Hortaea werneckii]|nr:hypothetical protein KC353_g26 [Hortaea werneckii]
MRGAKCAFSTGGSAVTDISFPHCVHIDPLPPQNLFESRKLSAKLCHLLVYRHSDCTKAFFSASESLLASSAVIQTSTLISSFLPELAFGPQMPLLSSHFVRTPLFQPLISGFFLSYEFSVSR